RFRSPSGLLLPPVVEKNLRPVLCANVRTLAIQRRRIVALPENSQQLLVSHLRWVVVDFHCLRMPRPARADIFITRVFQRAARVTYCRRVHTLDVAEGVFYSPETACSERCFCHGENLPVIYASNSLCCHNTVNWSSSERVSPTEGSDLRNERVRPFTATDNKISQSAITASPGASAFALALVWECSKIVCRMSGISKTARFFIAAAFER